jgi:hypothetical protein
MGIVNEDDEKGYNAGLLKQKRRIRLLLFSQIL